MRNLYTATGLVVIAGLLALLVSCGAGDIDVRSLLDADARLALYPIQVNQQDTTANFEAPEKAAATLYAALYQGDKERFLSSFTKDWRKEQENSYKSGDSFEDDHKRAKESRKAVWLVGEIVYEDAVFVLGVILRTDAPPLPLPLPVAPIQENVWKITQRFSSEPRFMEAVGKTHEMAMKIPELASEWETTR